MKVFIRAIALMMLLAASIALILPVGRVYAWPNVAIDVTRLTSYTPSFTTIISVLEGEGYTVDVWWSGEITESRLSGYCCLVIVVPQASYSASEVTAILNFVAAGNGLLFLGEYGKNWNSQSGGVYPAGADPIIGPFGVTINNDELYDPTDYDTNTYWPLIDNFPVAHPVTSGISIYMPAATATLVVDSPATTIAMGDDDTYAVDPDVPDPECDSPPEGPGSASGSYEPVLAASTYGAGRGVIAGDHNWITNAYASYYDNTQLVVNALDWLCGPPDFHVVPEVPLGTIAASSAMIIALIAFMILPKHRKPRLHVDY